MFKTCSFSIGYNANLCGLNRNADKIHRPLFQQCNYNKIQQYLKNNADCYSIF